jgi:predicted Zn-dependent protease
MQKIEWARALIEKNPKQAQPYNDLALALARRARETADPVYYKQAHEVLSESLRIEPSNFEARKTRVWVLLGQHEFKQALEEALELNRQVPDDQMVHAMLADANIELGNYKDAEKAAQTMFDMRGISVPALTRGAYLPRDFQRY